MNSKNLCLLMVILGILISPGVSKAQDPAGVKGVKLWYVSQKNGAQNILKDISGNKRPDFNNSSGDATNLNVNFHPAVFFNGGTVNNVPPFANLAFNQGTFVGIFYPDTRNVVINKDKKFIQFDYESNKTTLKNNAVDTNGHRKYTYGNPMQRTTLELGPGTNTKLEHGMKTVVFYYASDRNYMNIWGENKTITLSSAFTGYLPEFIYYNRLLTSLERWKLESYLAIKYGITLDTSIICSSGHVLWNINDVNIKKFNNRVAAIGNDLAAGIKQFKSNTTYEELYEGLSAYEYDANGEGENDNKMVPKNEQTSIKRSLTIGFADTISTPIPDQKFIFWGDDGQPTTLNTMEADVVNYPALLTIKRKWMLFNESDVPNPLKIEMSGLLFQNIYDPYDYLKYRYVLINLKPTGDGIANVNLFTYIGRKVILDNDNRLNFKNNKIVWQNFNPTNTGAENKHYFTFGRVPLLRFHQVNNQRVQINSSSLAVYVKRGLPITPELIPDTLTEAFRTNAEAKLKIKFTQGVAPYRLLVEKVTSAGLQVIKDVTLKRTDLVGSTLVVDNDANSVEEDSDNDTPTSGVAQHTAGNVTYYEFPISDGLEVNAVYKVTLSDKINQKESLAIKIKKRP